MARYTADSKEKVRDAVDMLDLVSTRTELKKSGGSSYMGRCPFHEERSGSLSVETAKKVYHCFGCGASGDCFRFVEELEGLDFKGAMEWLAARYNVELELEDEDPAAARRRQERERLLELLERTATFYSRYLWESKEARRAREYLAERGLGEEVLRTYRVGYSPKAWDTVLMASRKAGFSNRECYDAGLAKRAQGEGRIYDAFRGRVMFPLCDRRGRVLGFGARTLSSQDGPKYLNSNDNAVFHKGQHLYGADLARSAAARAGEVILCEGYTDVLALHQAGLTNTVGQMGTALTPDQVGELSRLAPTVHMALDADEAGQNAMLKAATVARGRGVTLRVVQLPGGQDPADVVAASAQDMRDRVAASLPFVAFRVRRALDGGDLSDAEGKDAVIDELRPVFAELPPGVLREELLQTVAERLDVKPSLVSGWLAAPAPAPASAGRPGRPAPRPEPAAPAFGDPGPPAGPAGRGAPGPARGRGPVRAGLDAAVQSERAFLAAVVALPQSGTTELERLDLDVAFTSPLHRRAAQHLLAHPGEPTTGIDPEDQELAALAAELAVRAGELGASGAILEAEARKVELAMVDRLIAQSRARGTGGVADLARRRQELQAAQHRALERAMAETAKPD
ncbi:DNA primase [Conexibacter sp. W3-3-2]|uniref:DNA primase n=1 Tax=Conexibacter sp. W3-3-2 TaxID=2675227 RepID=UPI0012B7F178|nr:DNA primase [Conexibacter sp. W3-3-2]MTD43033.1 DNA primase [Conexibacter sp. W3-3-2]